MALLRLLVYREIVNKVYLKPMQIFTKALMRNMIISALCLAMSACGGAERAQTIVPEASSEEVTAQANAREVELAPMKGYSRPTLGTRTN